MPGAFIIAGSDPGPRSETRRRPKTTHIRANLSDEHLRPTPVDARNGIQEGDRLVKGQGRCGIGVRSATDGGLVYGDGHGHRLGGGQRTEPLRHGRVKRGNLVIQKSDMGQLHRQELLLVVADQPAERPLSEG